jgi:hypothetical protein
MMPSFSKNSQKRLDTCDVRLQRVMKEVVKTFDCSVIEGHRSRDRQNQLFDAGKSQLKWPDSRHNSKPSVAVDVVPYPIDWKDRDRFHYFAGFVMATALSMGIKLRWGGDWDGDWETRDNSFDDLPHFELAAEELEED